MLVAEKTNTYRRTKKIPPYLVYEILNGKNLYYNHYKEVLSGKKTFEEIMGSSGLQSVLVGYLISVLVRQADEEKYRFSTGESGLHIDLGNNLATDVAVFEKSVLTPDKINTKYIDVPPKIAIEIDTKADLSEEKDLNYVHEKTQKLLDFGTEKVIWIFTATHKVMSAQTGEDWRIMDWQKDVEIVDKIVFNIGDYLKKEGIEALKK
jgi:Uma2 family endonuclease